MCFKCKRCQSQTGRVPVQIFCRSIAPGCLRPLLPLSVSFFRWIARQLQSRASEGLSPIPSWLALYALPKPAPIQRGTRDLLLTRIGRKGSEWLKLDNRVLSWVSFELELGVFSLFLVVKLVRCESVIIVDTVPASWRDSDCEDDVSDQRAAEKPKREKV